MSRQRSRLFLAPVSAPAPASNSFSREPRTAVVHGSSAPCGRSTGNIHGLKSQDYQELNWSMPTMFGDEKYGFTLVDIEDPRSRPSRTVLRMGNTPNPSHRESAFVNL